MRLGCMPLIIGLYATRFYATHCWFVCDVVVCHLLKDSGNCSQMTLSCNSPIGNRIFTCKQERDIYYFSDIVNLQSLVFSFADFLKSISKDYYLVYSRTDPVTYWHLMIRIAVLVRYLVFHNLPAFVNKVARCSKVDDSLCQ